MASSLQGDIPKVFKNPILEMEAIVGPKNLWPGNMWRLINLKHGESTDQITKICAFAYVNSVSPYLLDNVIRAVGGITAYADVTSAIHACYTSWNMSKDLRRNHVAYCVRKGCYLNLNFEQSKKSLPYSPSKSQSSPLKSPQKRELSAVFQTPKKLRTLSEDDIDKMMLEIPEILLSPNSSSQNETVKGTVTVAEGSEMKGEEAGNSEMDGNKAGNSEMESNDI